MIGSGKTCLLNVLSNKTQFSSKIKRLEGRIVYNIFELNQHVFDQEASVRYSAFCHQNDALFSYLTVRETLTLAAQFHLPLTVSKRLVNQLVNGVMRELGLG